MIKIRVTLICLIVLLLFLVAGVAWAGSSDNYAVEWWVKSGGGAPAASVSGDITLNGALGQTAIGNSTAGSNYVLGAGYWSARGPYAGATLEEGIYLPLILRNS